MDLRGIKHSQMIRTALMGALGFVALVGAPTYANGTNTRQTGPKTVTDGVRQTKKLQWFNRWGARAAQSLAEFCEIAKQSDVTHVELAVVKTPTRSRRRWNPRKRTAPQTFSYSIHVLGITETGRQLKRVQVVGDKTDPKAGSGAAQIPPESKLKMRHLLTLIAASDQIQKNLPGAEVVTDGFEPELRESVLNEAHLLNIDPFRIE